MASQLFEAPSHEAHYSSPEAHESHYSSPEAHYSSPEAHEAHYSSPEAHEFESEFESQETHYSSPYSSPEALEFEGEFETHEAHYSSPEAHEFEGEFESHEAHYSSPEAHEFEGEFEGHESGYSNSEYEYEYELEGEYFLGGLKRLASRVGRVVAPLAKRFAPQIARSLVGLIPGVGGLLSPIAGQLVGQLVKEAQGEAEAMQAEFFGSGEGEFELANTEAAHEAALAEVLAAQAAESAHEAEAESLVATSLPITIRITGGTRATRRVLPVLAQANRRLVRTLRTVAGPDGRQLVRLVPQINAQTAIALRNARRQGRPITGRLATQVMATVARRVLSNAPAVARAVARNIQIRNTVAPAHRRAVGIARCPGCVGRSRVAAAARSAVRVSNGRAPITHRRPRTV
jgi:hypothetical protein